MDHLVVNSRLSQVNSLQQKQYLPKLESSWLTFHALIILLTFTPLLKGVELTLLYWGDRNSQNLPYLEMVDGDSMIIGGAAALAGMVN